MFHERTLDSLQRLGRATRRADDREQGRHADRRLMRELLEDSFRAAVAAANPLQIVPARLPPRPAGRTFVAGAGKAAAAMALAVEKHWPADAPLDGIALTRYGHGLPTTRIRVIE